MKALGLALPLVVAAGPLSACGSDEDAAAAGARLPAGTADKLAGMSDEISSKLDAGDVCGAAAAADDLRAAVSEADVPDDLRAEAQAGADQLVNEVNCDSAPEPTATDEQDTEEHGEGDDESGGDSEGHGNGNSDEGSSGPPGQDQDFAPPGQAKIKAGI